MLAQATGRKRRPRRIPRQRFPSAARLAYYGALRKMLGTLRGQVTAALDPLPPAMRLDSPADDLKELFEAVAANPTPDWTGAQIEALAKSIADSVSVINRASIDSQLSAAVGFQIFPRDPALSDQLDLFVADNVRLVQSIRADLLDELHGMILRAARSGDRGLLAREIADRFGVADSRAELIAVDQVGSLNGELTRLRHQAVGVTQYEWDTSHDSRVRIGHALLQGSIQTWGKPPVEDPRTGNRAEPGQAIRCRCVAIPIVDKLVAALGA